MAPDVAATVVKEFLSEAARLLGEAALLARSADGFAHLDHFDRAINEALEVPALLFRPRRCSMRRRSSSTPCDPSNAAILLPPSLCHSSGLQIRRGDP